ncbi:MULTISPECIES: ABC transporter substrate-binding protein [unclassified Brachybacterium]|uniref:ABC transporter substrate-binding protein n=1 Tax=unclassified Brachybacterium TaxID=2623841 RepID=UPI003FE9C48F
MKSTNTRSRSRTPRSALSRRHMLGGVGLAGLGMAAASACTQRPSDGGGGGGASDLSLGVCWWGSEDRDAATLEALDVITEQKGWSFTTDYGDWGSYWDKLTTQLSGGTAPDIVSMNPTPEIVDFSQRGALLPLDDLVGGPLDISALSEEEQAAGKVGDELYGVTLATSCPALIYNKTKLDELGLTVPDSWTWEEFAEFAKSIYDASDGELYGAQDSTASQALDSWAIQKGLPGIYDAEKIALSEDDFVEWFEYWDDLRQDGGCVTAEINAADDGSHPNNPVVQGDAAIGMGFNISADVWAGLMEDELAFAPIPTDSDEFTGNYLGGAALFSINAETEHPDECAEFISLFISDPEVSKVLGFTRGMPNETALSALGDELEPAQQALADYSTTVAEGQLSDPPSAPTRSADVGQLLEQYADEAAYGNVAPDGAARAMFEEASEIELGS